MPDSEAPRVLPVPGSGAPESVRVPDGQPVVVGRVVGSYGVRGWLRVEPFNDPGESVLLTARRWLLQRPAAAQREAFTQSATRPPNAASPARGAGRESPARGVGRESPSQANAASALRFPVLPAWLPVLHCKVQGAALLASLEGIGVREAAEALRGVEIAVERTEFAPPGEDEFYWVDLIGCKVVTPGGVDLGVVEALDDHGAHPLLRTRGSDGRERLIPFVSAHVSDVDVRARRIVADWDPDF